MALLALIAGLLLSGTAAYYSIVGLTAIFPGAVFSIALMGASLEFAKLVSASWLYRNWSIAPKIIKGYFIFAIVILMFITSLGTFGYLSKVHIESSVSVADKSITIGFIEQQIVNETRQLDNAQRSFETLEYSVSQSFLDSVAVRASQKTERDALNAQIKESLQRIEELNLKLVPLKIENAQAETKIGPLKYIAELFYGKEQAKNYFDSAVRFVIILIVLVFDPLAVLLLIAANVSYMHKSKEKKVDPQPNIRYNRSIKDSIYNFMMNDDYGVSHVNKPEEPKGKATNFDAGGF